MIINVIPFMVGPELVILKEPDLAKFNPALRTSTGENIRLSKEVVALFSMSPDRLGEEWNRLFKQKYSEANNKRKEGLHEQALILYIEAQEIVNFIRSKGIQSDLIPIREIFCSYQIIQCYINLQRFPSIAMRQLHNITSALFELLERIVGDNKDLLAPLKTFYSENNYLKIEDIYSALDAYYKQNNERINNETLILIWKCSYLITRYSTIAHEFFLRSTPHMAIVKGYDDVTSKAGDLTLETYKKIPEELIESDATNQVFKHLTKRLDIFNDTITAEMLLLFGDFDDVVLQYHPDLIEKLKKIITDYLEYASEVIPVDFEYALEQLAMAYYAFICHNVENYDKYFEELNGLFKISSEHGCSRVAELIRLFQARAALRHRKFNDANNSYESANYLRNKDEKAKPTSPHIFDIWLDVTKAELLLDEYENGAPVQIVTDNIHEALESVIDLTPVRLDSRSPDEKLKQLEKTEKILSGYTTDINSDPEHEKTRAYNLPLVARINYLTGLIALKKAKIIGEIFSKQRNDTTIGHKLLEAFERARNQLRVSYSILLNMKNGDKYNDGYKDLAFLKEIFDAYHETVSYNYTLTGLDEIAQTDKLPGFEKMSEIARYWQLQNWIDVLTRIIKRQDLDPSKDYSRILSSAFEESLKQLIPYVSRTIYLDNKAGVWKSMETDSRTQGFIDHSLKHSSDNPEDVNEYYFYNQKGGKILIPISLDANRKIIIETAVPLTKHEKGLVQHIVKGIRLLLEILDQRKIVDGFKQNELPTDLKEKLVKSVYSLFEYLFQKHPETKKHSDNVAEFIKIIVKQLKETDPECDIDALEAEFAARLHDIGKVPLDPSILNKQSRLLPPEMDQVRTHVVLGADLLCGLLGVEHYRHLLAMVLAHHVQDGITDGYPVRLPSHQIADILPNLEPRLTQLTPEQRCILSKSRLSNFWQALGRFMNIIDQIEALTSDLRPYRNRMRLSNLKGYLRRRAGMDFDPMIVNMVLKYFREGNFDHLFTHYENAREEFENFEAIEIFNLDEIIQFFESRKTLIQQALNIDINEFIRRLKKSEGLNIFMSPQCLGWSICEFYIQRHQRQERGNVELSMFMNAAKEDAINEYKKHRENFFILLNEYSQTAST